MSVDLVRVVATSVRLPDKMRIVRGGRQPIEPPEECVDRAFFHARLALEVRDSFTANYRKVCANIFWSAAFP